MTQLSVEPEILLNLYQARFCDDGDSNLKVMCEENGWNESTFWKTVYQLQDKGFIDEFALGGNYRIDSDGIIFAEENSIAPEELITRNQQARTRVLDCLARAYEESDFPNSYTHLDTLCAKTDLERQLLIDNLMVLDDLGYVETGAPGSYQITYLGLEAVDDWMKRSSLANKFESLTDLAPQKRGMAFQKLFAEIIEKHGWIQEEGVRTSNEEMDVIASKGREYYLVECKWEKDPIEADVVRELYGKISNRSGMRGIIVSMSNFTSGAIDQVRDYSNSNIILLFGHEDTNSLLYGKESFEDIVDLKFQKLITRREVIVS